MTKRKMSLHSSGAAQFFGVTLTFITETFFASLAGWAMYDEFAPWLGFWPALVVGIVAGLVFFLLGLYVFILSEYAIDAVKVFSKIRGESPGGRIAWATFLVIAVILVESFINANRMIELPIANMAAKVFLWLCFQVLVFVPVALGKLVHAHVNATDPAIEERKFYNELDSTFYTKVRESLPNMTFAEIAQLKQGNTAPLVSRMVQEETDREVKPEHPLATGLRELDPPTSIRSQSNGRN